jgi:hypothetical protein
VVAAPELAGVVPVGRLLRVEQAHAPERDRQQLGAVDALTRGLLAEAALDPPAGEAGDLRERPPVVHLDDPQQLVLHLLGDVTAELAHVRLLPVLRPGPRAVDVAEPVELGAAVVRRRPDVLVRLAHLGVPHQWWEVVDGDDHADVVDR